MHPSHHPKHPYLALSLLLMIGGGCVAAVMAVLSIAENWPWTADVGRLSGLAALGGVVLWIGGQVRQGQGDLDLAANAEMVKTREAIEALRRLVVAQEIHWQRLMGQERKGVLRPALTPPPGTIDFESARLLKRIDERLNERDG